MRANEQERRARAFAAACAVHTVRNGKGGNKIKVCSYSSLTRLKGPPKWPIYWSLNERHYRTGGRSKNLKGSVLIDGRLKEKVLHTKVLKKYKEPFAPLGSLIPSALHQSPPERGVAHEHWHSTIRLIARNVNMHQNKHFHVKCKQSRAFETAS